MTTVSSPILEDYRGLRGSDGRTAVGDAHLRQSIADILTTPIGSRVMRRSYGSRLYALIDAPMNPGLVADLVAATAEALARWEPRILLKRVGVRLVSTGGFTLDLTVQVRGRTLRLEGVI